MWWIPNSFKIANLEDRLEWRVVCDFWAWVLWLTRRILEEWHDVIASHEIDPIFASEVEFNSAKQTALDKIDKTLRTYGPLIQQGQLDISLDSDNEAKIKTLLRAEQAVESFREERLDVSSNLFNNWPETSRFTSLNKRIGGCDLFTLGSVFYSSKNPAMLLFALDKLLSDSWEIIVFDYEGKANTKKLLKLDGKDWIEVIAKDSYWNSWELKDRCAIVIPKWWVKKARSLFR